MIIGLHGKAGSGKDFAADYLCEIGDFEKTSFAKPLYDMINCIGFNASSSMNREEKESEDNFLDTSIRKLTQTLGTEWGRELIDKDIWLKVIDKQIRFGNFVISDVRFDNEAEMIVNKHKGFVINIIGLDNKYEISTSHKSEHGIKEEYIFTTIVNDYTDNFKKLLDKFYSDVNTLTSLMFRMNVGRNSLTQNEIIGLVNQIKNGYKND